MFKVPVPFSILLSAPATGKAVKIPAAGRWLVPLLFDKDWFNAYLQRVSRSLLVRHGGISYWLYPHRFTSLDPKSSG